MQLRLYLRRWAGLASSLDSDSFPFLIQLRKGGMKMSVSERKSFGLAIILWFFLGGIGVHRIYVKEKVSVILWYWLACMVTIGLLWLVDVFLIKKWIDEANRRYKASL
jgi:TM2 domain-containing membrane protein YozV